MGSTKDGVCPISGDRGFACRVRSGANLANSYQSYHGMPLPQALQAKYFGNTITEYYSNRSGLKWYSPAHLGDSDFYQWLNASFPWYYSPSPTWDKLKALDILAAGTGKHFVEVGCGDGSFLKLAKEKEIRGIGVEINTEAIAVCKNAGLDVRHPSDLSALPSAIDTLVSIQSLEHVVDPVGYIQSYLKLISVTRLIIAVPCFETLLGRTLDPLVWPPHHSTIWSAKALASFGRMLGFEIVGTFYDSLSHADYCAAASRESKLSESTLPRLLFRGPWGPLAFAILKRAGTPWLNRRHSIVALLTRKTA